MAVLTQAEMVRISASALGHDRPEADLFVAPDQQILIRDWRAKALYGRDVAMVRRHVWPMATISAARRLPKCAFSPCVSRGKKWSMPAGWNWPAPRARVWRDPNSLRKEFVKILAQGFWARYRPSARNTRGSSSGRSLGDQPRPVAAGTFHMQPGPGTGRIEG